MRIRYARSIPILILLFSMLMIFSLQNVKAQLIEQKNSKLIESPYVNEYSLPWENSGVMGIGVDARGYVWFYMLNRSSIGQFTPSNGWFDEYPIEEKAAAQMDIALVAAGQFAFDDKGRVWFTDSLRNSIGMLDPSNREFKMHRIPTSDSGPLGILYDGRGSIWFAELYGNKIGRLNIESELLEEFPLPSENSGPAMLFMHSDGKIWFTEAFGERIGYIDPPKAEAGSSQGIREFTPEGLLSPVGIVVLNDVVWIGDHGSSNVVSFVPSNGTSRRYPTSPAQEYPDSLPNQVALDMKGRVWFAEHVGNRIGVIDPNDGSMTEYVVPTGPLSITLWLAISPSGEVWFTEWTSNKIGVVKPLSKGPISLTPSESSVTLDRSSSKEVEIYLNPGILIAFSIELRIVKSDQMGMKGISFDIEPRKISVEPSNNQKARLNVRTDSDAEAGEYVISVQAATASITQSTFISVRVSAPESSINFWMAVLLLPVIGLVAYLYSKWRRSKQEVASKSVKTSYSHERP